MLNFLIMKKQILNLGKALDKAEQKSINGGLGSSPCGTFPGVLIPNQTAESCLTVRYAMWYTNECWMCAE